MMVWIMVDIHLVQEFKDDVISLNEPDVVNIYGIFESKDTLDPQCPSMTTASLDGPTVTTNDLIIGETITGTISGAQKLLTWYETTISVSVSHIRTSQTSKW